MDELYTVLSRCYRRGVSWTDYMDVIKFVCIRAVTPEELSLPFFSLNRSRQTFSI